MPATGPAADNFARNVTETRDGRPFAKIFSGRIRNRAVAVIPLIRLGDPRDVDAAELRRMVEAQLGFALPHDGAAGAELWRQTVAAYENYGGAFLRQTADGREYCVAIVGRPLESSQRFVSAVAAGLPGGVAVDPGFVVPEAGVERFLAYHEAGGHCADAQLKPSTGIDVTAEDGYAHNLAELRADIFATLATAKEDGNTQVARTMLALRRAYSLQAAAAPLCQTAVNYGAVYRTAPGITAAIRWAEQALEKPAQSPDNLRNMSFAALLEEADRLRSEVRPSFAAFVDFVGRANRLRQIVNSSDPRTVASEAMRSGLFGGGDRAWLDSGVAAVRRIFAAPASGGPVPLHIGCPATATAVTARDRSSPAAESEGFVHMGGAGLGG